jgi:hypothetical protein
MIQPQHWKTSRTEERASKKSKRKILRRKKGLFVIGLCKMEIMVEET